MFLRWQNIWELTSSRPESIAKQKFSGRYMGFIACKLVLRLTDRWAKLRLALA